MLFGNEINNIVAVLKWSVSPLVGMARYHWGKPSSQAPGRSGPEQRMRRL